MLAGLEYDTEKGPVILKITPISIPICYAHISSARVDRVEYRGSGGNHTGCYAAAFFIIMDVIAEAHLLRTLVHALPHDHGHVPLLRCTEFLIFECLQLPGGQTRTDLTSITIRGLSPQNDIKKRHFNVSVIGLCSA